MAELSARHLISAGVSKVLIANRTEESSERLAKEFGGEAVSFERLADYLPERRHSYLLHWGRRICRDGKHGPRGA